MAGVVYLGLVAVITGIMGQVILWRRLSLFLNGARARGSFVRWEIRGVQKKFYHPVVSFEAHDGTRYEFVGGPGSSRPKEQAVYEIIYPPTSPKDALVLSFLGYWAAPAVFFILSAGAAFAAFQQK